MAITTVNNRTLKREADQWRLTTDFTDDANPIASNWEQNDTSGFGGIGSAMTESSGIFTFPSTGIYLVNFYHYAKGTAAHGYSTSSIEVTINDSSYVTASYSDMHYPAGTTFANKSCDYLVDVTDVANVKVRFVVDAVDSSLVTIGSTTNNGTGATFIRLGDT